MNIFNIVISIIVLLCISCDIGAQHETSKLIEDKFYNGNFGDQFMTPKWLANRNYINIEVQVKANKQILVDSVIMEEEGLFLLLDGIWEKIRSDHYNGVLTVHLGNDKKTDYEQFKKVFKSIEASYFREREKLALELFSKSLDSIAKNETQQINFK
ncbi:MAG: hypothetical protein AAGD05_19190, partial [Bacteroidota bacterium]